MTGLKWFEVDLEKLLKELWNRKHADKLILLQNIVVVVEKTGNVKKSDIDQLIATVCALKKAITGSSQNLRLAGAIYATDKVSRIFEELLMYECSRKRIKCKFVKSDNDLQRFIQNLLS